eukprot:911169-Prorocentrum_lima.AAC.1
MRPSSVSRHRTNAPALSSTATARNCGIEEDLRMLVPSTRRTQERSAEWRGLEALLATERLVLRFRGALRCTRMLR